MKEFNSIRLDDLPEGCQLLAAYIGLPLFLELTQVFGGESIYIPNLAQMQEESARRELRNQEICAAYHGSAQEIHQLSRKYKLSERQIRNIVRSSRPRP